MFFDGELVEEGVRLGTEAHRGVKHLESPTRRRYEATEHGKGGALARTIVTEEHGDLQSTITLILTQQEVMTASQFTQ